jgi:hypothetical protein
MHLEKNGRYYTQQEATDSGLFSPGCCQTTEWSNRSGQCQDQTGFLDIYGDGCEQWATKPDDCNPLKCSDPENCDPEYGDAVYYKNTDGVHAGIACCVCGGGGGGMCRASSQSGELMLALEANTGACNSCSAGQV